MPEPDFAVQDEGTVVLFHPLTADAELWLFFNASDKAQWMGRALACGHREAQAVAWHMEDDRLTLVRR